MGIVAAHRLKQMREFLVYEELAIWRGENGFDRVAAVEINWFGDHRSLPPPRSNTMQAVVRGECVERCHFDAAPEGHATHQRN